jgi:hypothetical protein
MSYSEKEQSPGPKKLLALDGGSIRGVITLEVLGAMAFWPQRVWNRYRADPLTAKLQRVFGQATTFGDPSLRTLLLMVLRNASTDSPWPPANNTGAKHNNPAHPDCNLKLPLWQLVRGSAAAALT